MIKTLPLASNEIDEQGIMEFDRKLENMASWNISLEDEVVNI